MDETNTDAPQLQTREARTLDRSTIQFPYVHLEDALTVARALLELGGVPCERDQLASKMGQNPGSGSFGLKLQGARMFGFIESGAQSKINLTDLGHAALDQSQERAAWAEAFLRVPLYRRVYDEFKGKVLPARPVGLENALQSFGVAPKQRERARWALDRSARSAGYFPNEKEDRLVAPVLAAEWTAAGAKPNAQAAAHSDIEAANVLGAGEAPKKKAAHDPFIIGLLDKLPTPGQKWPIADQAKWLRTAANIFGLMYEGGGEITVTEKAAQIPLPMKFA